MIPEFLRNLLPARWRMARDWEYRARRNAMHYVADFRSDWRGNEEEFFLTGLHDTERFLSDAGWRDTSRASLLEIGCGVGRMTRHLAARFRHVTALDISPAMIADAKRLNAQLQNAEFVVGNGVDLSQFTAGRFDYVLSYIVLQHLPEERIVLGYVEEGLRVLKAGGQFRFQMRNDRLERAPDTYYGATVDVAKIEALAARANAEVTEVIGRGTNLCFVTLRRR